jgi:hypothetical protein
MFARLREAVASGAARPYDLVVFDEAHKLAADREQDFYFRKTDRYRLAEALAGLPAASSTLAAGVVGGQHSAAHCHPAYGEFLLQPLPCRLFRVFFGAWSCRKRSRARSWRPGF